MSQSHQFFSWKPTVGISCVLLSIARSISSATYLKVTKSIPMGDNLKCWDFNHVYILYLK